MKTIIKRQMSQKVNVMKRRAGHSCFFRAFALLRSRARSYKKAREREAIKKRGSAKKKKREKKRKR